MPAEEEEDPCYSPQKALTLALTDWLQEFLISDHPGGSASCECNDSIQRAGMWRRRHLDCSFFLISSVSQEGVRWGAHADRYGREHVCSWTRWEPAVHSRAPNPEWLEAAVRSFLPALWTRAHICDHAAGAGLAQEPQSSSPCARRRGLAFVLSQRADACDERSSDSCI